VIAPAAARPTGTRVPTVSPNAPLARIAEAPIVAIEANNAGFKATNVTAAAIKNTAATVSTTPATINKFLFAQLVSFLAAFSNSLVEMFFTPALSFSVWAINGSFLILVRLTGVAISNPCYVCFKRLILQQKIIFLNFIYIKLTKENNYN
jgi:hypothetical protein